MLLLFCFITEKKKIGISKVTKLFMVGLYVFCLLLVSVNKYNCSELFRVSTFLDASQRGGGNSTWYRNHAASQPSVGGPVSSDFFGICLFR